MRDGRPKNVFMHSDVDTLRNPSSDIMWRHAPWLYEAMERRLLRCLDRVFCVRQTAVQRYKRDHPGLAERFAFIPTWVDTDVFVPGEERGESKESLRTSLLAELGIKEPARLLTWVGRLDHSKDPLLLIEAFRAAQSRAGDLHLVVVGDGILRKKVSDACSSDDLRGKVSLVGARRPADIADSCVRASSSCCLRRTKACRSHCSKRWRRERPSSRPTLAKFAWWFAMVSMVTLRLRAQQTRWRARFVGSWPKWMCSAAGAVRARSSRSP